MRLGVDPLDRRVNQSELEKSLYEVSVRLPDAALEALYQSDLGQSISQASQDQNWWYRRVEHLVVQAQLAGHLPETAKLVHRIGDWQFIYNALTTGPEPRGFKFEFINRRRYTAHLVQVLLELEADPSRLNAVDHVALSGTREALALMLADTRVTSAAVAIPYAIQGGSIESVKMLLNDPRFEATNEDLVMAVQDGNIDIVKLLLEQETVSPSYYGDNKAVTEAASHGYTEIFELLLSDERVTSLDQRGYSQDILERAIRGQRVNILEIFFSGFKHLEVAWTVLEAVRVGNLEIVKLLLDVISPEHLLTVNRQAVNIARNTKRRDIEELLLAKLS
ncbi:Hypothetical protein POVR2_LOCUS303 [uncultured virus]|nr:Hypothetical protein POVR2_LOCUS303 [uncultured virus]